MAYRWGVADVALIEKVLDGRPVEPSESARAARLHGEFKSLLLTMELSRQKYCYTYGRDTY